ncbi:hypothetical protein Mgra_00005574, partial [Meloidogyne graminicola]
MESKENNFKLINKQKSDNIEEIINKEVIVIFY